LLRLFLFILSWHSLSTKNFTIIYPDKSYESCAMQQASLLENYSKKIDIFTHNNPGRTLVFIEDVGGLSNGFANPLVNGIHIYSSIPYPSPHFGSMTSWWRLVSLHEYTHISNMTSVRGLTELARSVFGKFIQPNSYVPTWVAESYSVYSESQQFPFEGRLNEGFFDAYAEVCAREKLFPTLSDITYNFYDFPYNNSPYLWGGLMAEYRAEERGKSRMSKWSDLYSDLLLPLITLEPAHLAAYGKTTEYFYYGLKLKLLNEVNNKNFSAETKTVYKGKEYLLFLTSEGNHLYFLRQKFLKSGIHTTTQFEEIVKLDPQTGKSRVLIRENLLSNIPFKVHNAKVYYAKGNIKGGGKNTSMRGMKVVNDIYLYNMETEETKKIYSDDGTLKAFDISNEGELLIGRQTTWRGGIIEIIKGEKRDTLFESDEELPLDITIEGNEIAAVLHDENKGNKIIIIGEDTVRIEEPYAKNALHFSEKSLLFSSNRLGKWQGYKWKKDTLYKLTDLSFCAYPTILKNELYCISLSPEGERIEKIKGNDPKKIKNLDNLPDPALPTYDSLTYEEGGYLENFKHLLWDPILRIPLPYIYEDNYYFYLMGLGLDASGSRSLSWSLNHNINTGVTEDYFFNYQTLALTPYLISIETQRYNDTLSTMLGVSYPLYLSLEKGVEGIYLDVFGFYEKDIPNSECRQPLTVSPALIFGDHNKDFLISPSFTFESKNLGSDINRNSFYLSGEGLLSYSNLSILFSGVSIWDIKNPDSTLIKPVCGEEKRLTHGYGAAVEADYQLMRIGGGVSVIPIYFDGIWLRPFGEIFYSREWKKPVATVGGLITLETSTLYLLNLKPTIGFGYRIDEGKFYTLWGIFGELEDSGLELGVEYTPKFLYKNALLNFGNFRFSIAKHFELSLGR
jgi:hypothetical protein